ncbi:MAG: hypothetical protein V2J51_15940 [Erythrobacter sp.]|jgi:hypothetical protein|nr:hypothetical protein [Erythrobacter sp.]
MFRQHGGSSASTPTQVRLTPTGWAGFLQVVLLVSIAAVPGLLIAQDTIAEAIKSEAKTEIADNRELAEMFAKDQEVRKRLRSEMKSGQLDGVSMDSDLMEEFIVGDAQRLERVSGLLEIGALHTAQDYYHAAFLFQHGKEAKHYLRAHHVAMVAMKLGHEEAPWIAAASLDRYLVSIGQPQIYGTQSSVAQNEGAPLTSDSRIISNRERAQLDVPPTSK